MASSIGSTSASRHSKHLWVRESAVALPFVWRGLLPLLGLILLFVYALALFARNDIEASVRTQTRDDLNTQGYSWVNLQVSGQDVSLSGEQPAPGAGDAALQIARRATCRTWAGPMTCAVAVSGRFTEAAPRVASVPAATAAAVCEKSLADIVGSTQIEFSTRSAVISPKSTPVLDALAKAASVCGGVIRVEGYTDSVGRADFNRTLSNERAAAVMEALTQRGFPRDRLVAVGLGSERPIADNDTRAGQAKNRRIEFHIVDTSQH